MHPKRISYSAALCRGLIEAADSSGRDDQLRRAYSAALCRGLIEAGRMPCWSAEVRRCIPRLYAAASLKPLDLAADVSEDISIPRLYAAASLKPAGPRLPAGGALVFRGSMPRPH